MTTQSMISGSKTLAKLFGAFALATGGGMALPSCATDAPAPEAGALGKSAQAQAQLCGRDSCPTDSGTCGTWTCNLATQGCVFKADQAPEDGCIGSNDDRGTCVVVGDGRTTPQYLMCCTGCYTGKPALEALCHPGNAVGYCGSSGGRCDSCTQCESCSAGSCEPTSGAACGTCQVCNAGSCDPRQVGAACSGGHCAAGNTCCTGNACIEGDSCVAADDKHCGSDGSQCTDCGQCGTCSNGACEDRTGACDDGDPCTENDTCSNGSCAGTAINVDDGNLCTDDDCTAEDGVVHVSLAEGATGCSDGNDCSTGDRCTDHDNDSDTPRVCKPTGGVICENENPCKSLQCVGNACPFPDLPDDVACDPANRCILGATCQAGTCTGEMRNCNDDNPCTTDSCEPNVDDPDADPATGCKHVARTANCDDGNPCTEDDACDGDTCVGTPKTCAPLDECHGVGTCDPGVGECTDPRLNEGTACENTGTCEEGECVGGTPTASGGAGGSAGSGTGGTGTGGSTAGEAGEGSGAVSGEGGGSTGGSGGAAGGGGSGATSSGGSGGRFKGPTFARDPGGCSCEVPGGAPSPGGALGVIVAGALAFFTRRRRRAAA
jgi:MYXO-CTERM domain-containing protein